MLPGEGNERRQEIDVARAAASPSRAEVFGAVSRMYRIMTLHHMALMSLKNPDIDEFSSEMKRASDELNELLPQISKFVGFDADDD